MKIYIREKGEMCSGPEAAINDDWIVVWVDSDPASVSIGVAQAERYETLAAEITNKEETIWVRIDKNTYSEVDSRKPGGNG
jgi:hypothetical protein